MFGKNTGIKIKSNIPDEKNEQKLRDHVLAPAEVFRKHTKQHFVIWVISSEKHKQNVRSQNPPRNAERLTGDLAESNEVFAVITTLKSTDVQKEPRTFPIYWGQHLLFSRPSEGPQ